MRAYYRAEHSDCLSNATRNRLHQRHPSSSPCTRPSTNGNRENPSHHRGWLAEQTAGDYLGAVTEDETMEVESACWRTGGGVAVAATGTIALPLLLLQLRFLTTRLQFSAGPHSAKKTRETVGWEYYFASGYPVREWESSGRGKETERES